MRVSIIVAIVACVCVSVGLVIVSVIVGRAVVAVFVIIVLVAIVSVIAVMIINMAVIVIVAVITVPTRTTGRRCCNNVNVGKKSPSLSIVTALIFPYTPPHPQRKNKKPKLHKTNSLGFTIVILLAEDIAVIPAKSAVLCSTPVVVDKF